MSIWLWIALYFVLGVIALSAFELVTQRISRRIKTASLEARDKMIANNIIVGQKTAVALLILAMLVYWPFVLIGAMQRRKE